MESPAGGAQGTMAVSVQSLPCDGGQRSRWGHGPGRECVGTDARNEPPLSDVVGWVPPN
ncbi:uncharacterized protein TRAVEDRAFT_27933, partial [Trametes versicolor FP-101664 SS1]|uniref:uncharacterized protein n=1 Tax=Trametes versicolor (strain FP-101664) TaxID=717944 RepID=UPI0004624488